MNQSETLVPASAPTRTLTASVVGGGFGGRLSLDALRDSPHFQLLAVADVRAEVRAELERLHPGIRTFPDHHRMFAECPTDVVCVSTYAPTHVEIADAAMRLQLAMLLVEKPLSDTAAAARSLLERVKARRLPLVVPHGMVTMRAPTEIVRLVGAGELGALRLIEIQSPCWDIINAGIHWFHLALGIAGRPPVRTVQGACDRSTRTFRDGMQVETTSVTYVTLENGVRIVLQAGDDISSNGRGKAIAAHFRIVGTGGVIEYHGWADRFQLCNRDAPAGAERVFPEEPTSRHRRHLERLLPMVAGGPPDHANAEDSLAALEICEAAYLSARCGAEVRFPLASFSPPPPVEWDPGRPYAGTGGGRDGRQLGRS